MQENELHIYVKIWAGEWDCEVFPVSSLSLSFVSEKIDHMASNFRHLAGCMDGTGTFCR